MSKLKLDKVLVIDVESTCWEPPEVQPKNEISEIIEIGITVVDVKNLKILSNDSILVKPQRSKVSNFCTKLTTLTQEQVDTGISFGKAMQLLEDKYDSNNTTFVSWGDYDRKMFEKNCVDFTVRYPFGPRHMNLKNTFALFQGLPKEVGLTEACKKLGREFQGTHHRGGADSRNIAAIYLEPTSYSRGL